jgi:protein-disulfide isomerase
MSRLLFGAALVPLLLAAAQTSIQPAGTAGPPPAASRSALDKKTMEDYVRHLFVWGPQITVSVSDAKASELPGFKEVKVLATAGQASQEEVFFVSNDGKKILRGTVFDVGKSPFQADLEKIKTDLSPSFGTPGAPVVVVVYSDFQCSYCKEEAKIIRESLPAAFPNEVRVYFKDFPLEPIHPWAKPAAIAGRCIFRQKPVAFWEYHDWIFENQAEIKPENLKQKVLEFAGGKGIEPIQLGACIDNRATEADVNKSAAEARALGVNSTPTVFVNGRRLVGQVAWPQLKQIIEHEIGYQKAYGGGEKCCELTLPSPVKP